MLHTVLSDLLGFLVLVFCPCKLHNDNMRAKIATKEQRSMAVFTMHL